MAIMLMIEEDETVNFRCPQPWRVDCEGCEAIFCIVDGERR